MNDQNNIKFPEVGELIQKSALPLGILKMAQTMVVVSILLIASLIIIASGSSIGYGGLVIALGLFIFGVISLLRTRSGVAAKIMVESQKVQIESDEKLVGYASGLIRAGWRGGSASLSTERIKGTENAMIVTNQKVIFITVPMAGVGKIISGMDISTAQWILSQAQIKEKLEGIIRLSNLQGALDAVTVNLALPLDTVEAVEPNGDLAITLRTKDQRRLTYNFFKKEEYEKACALLNKS